MSRDDRRDDERARDQDEDDPQQGYVEPPSDARTSTIDRSALDALMQDPRALEHIRGGQRPPAARPPSPSRKATPPPTFLPDPDERTSTIDRRALNQLIESKEIERLQFEEEEDRTTNISRQDLDRILSGSQFLKQELASGEPARATRGEVPTGDVDLSELDRLVEKERQRQEPSTGDLDLDRLDALLAAQERERALEARAQTQRSRRASDRAEPMQPRDVFDVIVGDEDGNLPTSAIDRRTLDGLISGIDDPRAHLEAMDEGARISAPAGEAPAPAEATPAEAPGRAAAPHDAPGAPALAPDVDAASDAASAPVAWLAALGGLMLFAGAGARVALNAPTLMGWVAVGLGVLGGTLALSALPLRAASRVTAWSLLLIAALAGLTAAFLPSIMGVVDERPLAPMLLLALGAVLVLTSTRQRRWTP